MLDEFARWRYQLDIQQLQCLVKFVRMWRRRGMKSSIYDCLLTNERCGCSSVAASVDFWSQQAETGRNQRRTKHWTQYVAELLLK